MNKNSIFTYLFKPFSRISDYKALFIGTAVILAAIFLGSFRNVQFDGALDVHIYHSQPLWRYFYLGLISWLCLSVIFLLSGLLIKKTDFRLIDLLGTQAFAHWPNLIMIAAVFGMGMIPNGHKFLYIIPQIIISMAVVWKVTLLYQSYMISFDLKGAKAVFTFIFSLIVAEIVSKVIILNVL